MARRYLVIIETPEWVTQKTVKLSLKGTYRYSGWKFVEIRELDKKMETMSWGEYFTKDSLFEVIRKAVCDAIERKECDTLRRR